MDNGTTSAPCRQVRYSRANVTNNDSGDEDEDETDKYRVNPDEIFKFQGVQGSLCSLKKHSDQTLPEKLAQRAVSIACTGVVGLALSLCVVIAAVGLAKVVLAGMYWSTCQASPKLPGYLLTSGLAPALFYVTCRTRKWRGSPPARQRILARWQYSTLRYTFDAQRAWQAGLAALLSLFLLAWLVYGTFLTVVTMTAVNNRPAYCFNTDNSTVAHGSLNDSSDVKPLPSSSLVTHGNLNGSSADSGNLLQNPGREERPLTRREFTEAVAGSQSALRGKGDKPKPNSSTSGNHETTLVSESGQRTAANENNGGSREFPGSVDNTEAALRPTSVSAKQSHGDKDFVRSSSKSQSQYISSSSSSPLPTTFTKARTSAAPTSSPLLLSSSSFSSLSSTSSSSLLSLSSFSASSSKTSTSQLSSVSSQPSQIIVVVVSSNSTKNITDDDRGTLIRPYITEFHSPWENSPQTTSASSSLTSAGDDRSVTSAELTSVCGNCDRKFLTMCLYLVLFDWAYLLALLLNLLVASTVPCCCVLQEPPMDENV